MGSGADLMTCLLLSFLLSSHDMVTPVTHSKDERTRNAALLRYTCGHDGRYFGLFHLIVMDHHIEINSKIVSKYDQDIPQSQTADNPMAPRGRAAQPSRDTRKTN